MKKRCNKCKQIKPVRQFYKHKRNKDGYYFQCKDCVNDYYKSWKENNPKKVKMIQSKYAKNNPEKESKRAINWQKNNPKKVKEIKKRFKENNPRYMENYRKNNSENIRKYLKKWLLNPRNKLSHNISVLMNRSLKRNKNNKHWEIIVNFTLQDLIAHLEKQFRDGMNWQNMGKWQIDHIRPISRFDFNSYEDSEFRKCWALSNLQPLWAFENISKGNKIGGGL
ncbi:hypothetical protein ES708_33273 [subsurface metagenome]